MKLYDLFKLNGKIALVVAFDDAQCGLVTWSREQGLREDAQGETVNIANPFSNGMLEIVHAMERVLDTRAEFDLQDRTSGAPIDVGRIEAAILRCGIRFGDTYLARVIEKYYGEERSRTVAIPAAIPLRPTLFPSSAWQL